MADVLQAIELDGKSLHKAFAAEIAAKRNLCLTAAAFVGYDGEMKPEDTDLTEISKDTNAHIKREIAQAFGKWWRSVCEQLHHELKAGLSKPGEAPSGIDLLTSEQLYLSARLNLVIAIATQYADVVALFQALGGGWWNRSDVEQPE